MHLQVLLSAKRVPCPHQRADTHLRKMQSKWHLQYMLPSALTLHRKMSYIIWDFFSVVFAWLRLKGDTEISWLIGEGEWNSRSLRDSDILHSQNEQTSFWCAFPPVVLNPRQNKHSSCSPHKPKLWAIPVERINLQYKYLHKSTWARGVQVVTPSLTTAVWADITSCHGSGCWGSKSCGYPAVVCLLSAEEPSESKMIWVQPLRRNRRAYQHKNVSR